MRVEIKIDKTATDPFAVIYTHKLTPEISEVIDTIEGIGKQNEFLIAKKDDRAFVLDPADVEIIRTEEGAIICHTNTKESYPLTKTLKELMGHLNDDFIQISKSAVVNLDHVDHLSPSFNGTMHIVMKNGISDYISRSYLKEFKTRLGL